ncbi:MAG: hypothetical protein QF441_12550 [Bacteriovoracaceae bacterium]|jgi:competence protein ComEC|nr:hypothetical protein [Bacteriovoracaceae bacterium]
MRYLVLIFFTLCIYPENQFYYWQKKSYFPFNIEKRSYSTHNYGFYKALVTGNKKELPREQKKLFKKYGLSHILTPSGIHLSSVIFLFKYFKTLELLFLIVFFIYLQNFSVYNSLERVTLFRLLYIFIKKLSRTKNNIEISFIGTFFLSALIGHYSANALSYIYSLLFWGTIICFKEKPLKMILMLNLSLLFISSYTNQLVSPFSLLINTVYTFIFSSLFPLFLFNNFLPTILNYDGLLNFIITLLINSLKMLDHIIGTPLVQIPLSYLSLSILLFLNNKNKTAVLLICLSYSNTQVPQQVNIPKRFINLESSAEIIKQKNKKVEFYDKKCKVDIFKIRCKKRPSNWGGPRL